MSFYCHFLSPLNLLGSRLVCDLACAEVFPPNALVPASRHIIPRSTVQYPACFFLVQLSPLLEEGRHPGIQTLVVEIGFNYISIPMIPSLEKTPLQRSLFE